MALTLGGDAGAAAGVRPRRNGHWRTAFSERELGQARAIASLMQSRNAAAYSRDSARRVHRGARGLHAAVVNFSSAHEPPTAPTRRHHLPALLPRVSIGASINTP